MIYLKEYTSKICDAFEQNLFGFEKLSADDKDNLYGDYQSNFEKTVNETLRKLIDDIKKEIRFEINEKDYM